MISAGAVPRRPVSQCRCQVMARSPPTPSLMAKRARPPLYLSGGVAANSAGPDRISTMEDVLSQMRAASWTTGVCRCWSTSTPAGRGVQHRPHHPQLRAASAWPPCTWTRWSAEAQAIVPAKEVVTTKDEMVDRVKAAVDARSDPIS